MGGVREVCGDVGADLGDDCARRQPARTHAKTGRPLAHTHAAEVPGHFIERIVPLTSPQQDDSLGAVTQPELRQGG